MYDGFGRNIEYLRVSVTDRCNLRCVYCMPEEGVPKRDHSEILTYDEILRLAHIFAGLGMKKVRLTGGEPLVRGNIEYLIKGLKNIEGIEKVCMTTNGVLLEDKLETLTEAGLDSVNISIDSLRPEKFLEITKRNELENVLRAVEKAASSPRLEVKLNCVPAEYNENELTDMADYFLKKGMTLRFIELMPIGYGKTLKGISTDELKNVLEKHFGVMEKMEGEKLGGPSRYYSVKGFKGKIGFISAMTHEFCSSCNRVRLTAEGCLKTCLQYSGELSLKELLCENDNVIRESIMLAILNKPQNHKFRSQARVEGEEGMMMAQIGG